MERQFNANKSVHELIDLLTQSNQKTVIITIGENKFVFGKLETHEIEII